MAEKEYIEREAAINAMCRLCSDTTRDKCSIQDICNHVCRLEAVPAADVRPVRHGRWTGHDIGNGRLSIDDDTCSLCGSRFYQIAETGCVWHYCPNCGCAMEVDK